MSINEAVIYLMTASAIVGAVDRILGNRLGMGEKFEEGITAIGALALSMVGIIALSPVLANILRPVIVPLFSFVGADPSVFAGMLLANDMVVRPLPVPLPQTMKQVFFPGLLSAPCSGRPSFLPFR